MTALDVIELGRRWTCEAADALAWLTALPSRSVSLVLFSPPYEAARRYAEVLFKLRGQAWVDWLRPIIVECARVSSGLVCVNMASKVEGGSYTAAVEWLVADLTRLDGLICGPSPYAWVKSENRDDAPGNGTPGSGGPRYQRRDWEPVYTFCLPDRLPLAWSDNVAFGKPPKYGAGGDMSNRDTNGVRANDPWNKKGRGPGQGPRKKNGQRAKRFRAAADGTYKGAHDRDLIKSPQPEPFMGYDPPKISNPGNVLADALMASDVLRVPVGGGKLGCPIAHEGEAPMALAVAERFVCWFAEPASIVLDPFTGTGTTAHAAILHGRRFIGCDLRGSQVQLTERRMAMVSPGLFA